MDAVGIKQERKTVVACAIWFAVLFLPFLRALPAIEPLLVKGSFTIAELVGLVLGIPWLLCGFHGFRALRKLTDMLYVHPRRLMAWYTVLIFVLCWLWIFMPVALIILWNDSKKVLTSGEKLTKQKL